MELIFENVKKGGAYTGAGAPGLTGAGRSKGAGAPGLTGAGHSTGAGNSTGAGHSTGAGAPGLTGAGKKYSGRAMGQLARHHTKLYGAGWFGDFVDGFKDGFNSFKDGFTGVVNTVLPIADLVPGMSAVTAPLKMVNNALGGSKPRRTRGGNKKAVADGKEAFKELMEENSKSAPVGGKKPLKTRIELVKDIMKREKLSLTDASSYVKTHELKYKK
jgi:hypothetical protein